MAGYYCSGDPAYIATAISQMKEIGVAGLLLTWHGWGDVDFDGDIDALDFAAETNAVETISAHLRDNAPGIKAAIVVEPFFLNADPKIPPSDVPIQQRQEILDYIWEHFYEPFPGQVFHVDNKPLVVNWKNNEGRWLLNETGDLRFTYREWGVISEGADWEFTAHQGLDGMKIGRDGAIWIAPRFDEFHLWNQGVFPEKSYDDLIRLDPFLNEGLYDQAWQKVYENKSSISMVLLYGWNPWAEASSIEPALPYGYLLARKTAWFYGRLADGYEYQDFGPDTTLYPNLWNQPFDLRQFIGHLDAEELGLASGTTVEEFLGARLWEAQNLVESRLLRTYSPANVPAGVRNIHLRLTANIYNYILMNKRNPVMQVGEFNFQLNDNSGFTDALKDDLAQYRVRRSVRVLFPLTLCWNSPTTFGQRSGRQLLSQFDLKAPLPKLGSSYPVGDYGLSAKAIRHCTPFLVLPESLNGVRIVESQS